jgi:hypothetical protein
MMNSNSYYTYTNEDLYSADIIIGRSGVLEKNRTKWSNEELHEITDGLMNLDRINEVERRRLLLIKLN